MWLKEAGGRESFFPDNRNSRFVFTGDVGLFITTLMVEGSPSGSNVSRDGESSAGFSRVFSTVGSKPLQASPLFTSRKASSSSAVNVKIVQAIMKKGIGSRPEFKPLHVEFVKVTEETANVLYLSHVVKGKWGSEYVLVTADGMELEDSSGTQGEL